MMFDGPSHAYESEVLVATYHALICRDEVRRPGPIGHPGSLIRSESSPGALLAQGWGCTLAPETDSWRLMLF